MNGVGKGLLTAAALVLCGAGSANAATLEAEGILPPGQSGYVSIAGVASGTGSPHLTDQAPLFENFEYRDITFDQPGTSESPRPGVTISRDSFGVPTITGQTEDDAWFGVGYAVAQDRLFQLDLFRRATSGRLSEILGPTYLDDDLIARRDYYTDDEVDSMLAKTPQKLQDRTQSYADGINAWIDAVTTTQASQLPGEFVALADLPIDDWTVRDSARVGIFLARTVPSSDGAEVRNALALQEAGPKAFQKLLPVRTKGALATVPGSRGKFPAQPGRSKAQQRKGFRKSKKFVAKTDFESITDTSQEIPRAASAGAESDPGAGLRAILPSPGGSFMYAVRNKPEGEAYLFNGPQLGFSVPELFVEFEVHSPSSDIHGVSAAGIPLVGIGHNGKVAWGFTSGLSDEDDLYVEKVTGPETYRFKGEERQMDCRDEVFTWQTPPTDLPDALMALIGLGGDPNGAPPAGTTTERICRTVHGPVQQTGDGIALARRYAIWNRELETIVGIDQLNRAKDIRGVDKAMEKVTWNENVMAVDDRGHIGYWHPGLHQLKPKTWDERLPFPGTGKAEWRGLLPEKKRPQVIDPSEGWLANWNNVPSEGWTNGDSEALERATGPLHRVRILRKLVARVEKAPTYAKTRDVMKIAGTTAQQFPFRDRKKLKRAAKKAASADRAVFKRLASWDGSYDTEDGAGTVDPGVAIWEEFKDQVEATYLKKLGATGVGIAGQTGLSHMFDITRGEAAALLAQGPGAYRRAMTKTNEELTGRFGSADPATWREPRRLYPVGAQGAGATPELEFFDRGTWNQAIAMGR